MALNFTRPYAASARLSFGGDSLPIAPVSLALAIVAAVPVFACRMHYDNRVQRGLAAAATTVWNTAQSGCAATGGRWQAPVRTDAAPSICWRPARILSTKTDSHTATTESHFHARTPLWQAGVLISASAADKLAALRHARRDLNAEWRGSIALAIAASDGCAALLSVPRDADVLWDVVSGLARALSQSFAPGVAAYLADRMAWTLGAQPLPGREPDVPVPPINPVFQTDASIDFNVRWLAINAALYFGRRDVRVPVRRVYIVSNTAQIVRLPGREPIHAYSASMSIDADSWAWSMSATLDHSAMPLIAPDASGPVAVEITINSGKWVALVESYRTGRTFGQKTALSVSGRSMSAWLAEPYAAARTYTPGAATTARQLAESELARAGLASGFSLDWNIDDWLVPEGAWSCQNMTPMQVINRIADAAGAYVNSHPSEKSLIVRPRYPLPPWQWAAAAVDKILPPDVVKTLNLDWQEKPVFNAVYVAGERAGIVGHVKRTGTAGDLMAPTVVDGLITAQAAARQRGTAILSDTGRQARVTLEMPLMDEIGLLPPGKFIEVDEDAAWRGLVRSTGVSADWGDALKIAQTIEVERHYA